MKAEQTIREIKKKTTEITGQNDGWKRLAMTGAALAVTAAVFAGGRREEVGMAAQNVAVEVTGETAEKTGPAESTDVPVISCGRAAADDLLAYEETAAELTVWKMEEEERTEEAGRAAEEPEGSFHVAYQGHMARNTVELAHCDCVYDAEGIQVYTYYIYWPMVPETFPYNQYVLYIRTPEEEFQIYPVKDFLVDEKQGILYMKRYGDNGFESVRSMPLTEKGGSMRELEEEVFDWETAQKMLCDGYGMTEEKETSGGGIFFSDVTVEFTGIDTEDSWVVTGETGGIEKSTGNRCYVNWKMNVKSGRLAVEPCILKQYDPIKDKEELAACNRAFDRIEQGDWSGVKPIEKMYVWGSDSDEWLRMDVNGDGMPELIDSWVIEELPDYEDSRKRAVFAIYAYQDGMVEMVYLDDCDGMEFLFITASGELVYEWGVSGGPCTSVFRKCRFDQKWNKEYLDTLVRYRFTEYEEESEDYYAGLYPDTFGTGGAGTYFLRERPKTEEELKQNRDGSYVVREYLTEEEFLKMYEEWTGWDFYKAQYMY